VRILVGHYCAAQFALSRVLEGEGRASPEIRRAAFDNEGLSEPVRAFVNKVAHRATTVTDGDIGTLKNAGLSEDEIYEIVVCAAIGQATRQHQNALAALSEATGRN
jgi:alkylhydroperoxidase family enzyme